MKGGMLSNIHVLYFDHLDALESLPGLPVERSSCFHGCRN